MKRDDLKRLESVRKKDFGEYTVIVRAWAKKHDLAYVMPEIKELLDAVKKYE